MKAISPYRSWFWCMGFNDDYEKYISFLENSQGTDLSFYWDYYDQNFLAVTLISQLRTKYNSKKIDLNKSPVYTPNKLSYLTDSDNEEKVSESIVSLNDFIPIFELATGVGVMLGFNGIQAIHCNGIFREDLISSLVEELQFSINYQWVAISGSHNGFFIIFQCLNNDFAISTRYIVDSWNCSFEYRKSGHLVLPPSEHVTKNRYLFLHGLPKYPVASIKEDKDVVFALNRFFISHGAIAREEFFLNEIDNRDELLSRVNISDASKERFLAKMVGDVLAAARSGQSFSTEEYFSTEAYIKDTYKQILDRTGDRAMAQTFASFIPGNLISIFSANEEAGEYLIPSIAEIEALRKTFEDFDSVCEYLYGNELAVGSKVAGVNPSPSTEDYEEISLNSLRKSIDSRTNSTYLFFDTETNGLPFDYSKDSSLTENWPRLVQLAWIETTSNGEIIEKKSVIVKPENFQIYESSSEIHGITNEKALEEGRILRDVLIEFYAKIVSADLVIGHNVNFDIKVIGAEYYRLFNANPLMHKKSWCTMLKSVDLLKIPHFNGYKWPKLSELYRFTFSKELQNAHDAGVDIFATYEVFFTLVQRGMFNLVDQG